MQPFGMILGTFPINECVAKGKEAIGWDKKWRGWKAPRTQSRKQRGIGMGTSMGWGDWEREEVGMSVEVQKDGSVVLYTGTQDVGTDSKTSLIQLLAEALDTSIDKVCIVTGDTRTTPFDFGTCGSRVLFLGGQALLKAAEDVKDQILGLATEKLSVSPGVLRLRDGAVEDTRLGGKRIPIGELLQTSVFGYGSLGPEEMVAHLRPKYWVGGAAANFAEVEVDMETGEVEILNLVCAHDVGQAVNPAVVENQISGAAVQGIGYALTEQLRFDPEKNAYLESNYTDYKIPTIGDTGRIVPIIVEGPEPVGPYGAKCIGEIALNCTAAAIANAIRDAIGTRLEELPMTAERVRKQIGTSVA